MNILICGLGSIGKRHAKILLGLGHAVFSLWHNYSVYGVDLGGNRSICYGNKSQIDFDAAFICTPTHEHINFAIREARHGTPLFIEKPIDCTTDRLDELLHIVKAKNLPTYVAYPFRHHENVLQLQKDLRGQVISSAHFMCDTNIKKWGKKYSQKKETGGGAILELSHEIDMAEFLFGPVVEISGTKESTGYFTDAETRAGLVLIHSGGMKSYVSLRLDLVNEYRKIVVSIADNQTTNHSTTLTSKYALERAYERQIKYFLGNLDNPHMDNNLESAAELFKKILEFRNAV